MKEPKAESVEEYLSRLPKDVRAAFERIRRTVKKIAPDATERISYGMPTFFTHRALVGYAAHNHHCSFYPWSSVTLKNFKKELSGFETSAGTVRFTIEKPIPAVLIKKIVLARLLEQGDKDKILSKKKSENTGGELPSGIGAPAQRALAAAGIRTLKELSKRRESEVSALHGIGPKARNILRKELKRTGLSYKK